MDTIADVCGSPYQVACKGAPECTAKVLLGREYCRACGGPERAVKEKREQAAAMLLAKKTVKRDRKQTTRPEDSSVFRPRHRGEVLTWLRNRR